jgi:hypothetical protein
VYSVSFPIVLIRFSFHLFWLISSTIRVKSRHNESLFSKGGKITKVKKIKVKSQFEFTLGITTPISLLFIDLPQI